MGKLGNLYYEVKIKDATSDGFASIEKKIRNLKAIIKPRIYIKDIQSELDRVGNAKNLRLRVEVSVNTKSLVTSINNITSKGKEVPVLVKANTSTLVTDIQNAINKGEYSAKIIANTSGIVDAIKNAVSKPIDVTANVKTNLKQDVGSVSSNGGKSKNPNLTTSGGTSKGLANDLEKEQEKLQKAYQKVLEKSRQTIANVTRFSNLRANGEMSVGLSAARDRILQLKGEMQKTITSGGNLIGSKPQELSNAIRVAHEQMRLYRSELQKTGAIQKRLGSERPLSNKVVSRVDNSDVIKRLSVSLKKYESEIASLINKVRNTHGTTSSTENFIRGLNAQIDALSRKAEAARVTIEKLSNMRTVTSVNHLAPKNSTIWKEQQEAERLARASRRAEITRAFKEQQEQVKAEKDALLSRRKEITKAYNDYFNAQQRRYSQLMPKSSQAIANIGRLSSANGGNMSVGLSAARDRLLSIQSEIRQSQSNGFAISEKKFQELSNAIRVAKEQMALFKKECAKSSSEQKKQGQATKAQKTETEKFQKELDKLSKKMNEVGKQGGWLKDQLQNLFSLYIIKDFFMNLINIGGEFEKQKLALNAMLGSMDRANTLYTQIKNLAVESPFTFGDLTSYTKQLTSFGFEYKDIFNTTKRLADISAGVGVDMGRIILAYGQVFTAHFLRGQELRQFTEAGIPMVEALANRFTKLRGEAVSAGDVFEMISKKEVAFEDVKAVIDEMTNSGGRFYNMQEKLSESLSGKWSNLKDQVEIMYSEIESANNSLLKGIVGLMISFVKSWKELRAISVGLVVFFTLLATKKALLSGMVNGVTNGLKNSLAASYANQNALKEEILLYNQLTQKIRERNKELLNGQAVSRNPALLNGTGLKQGGAIMTGNERRNLWLQRARMNLLGANKSSVGLIRLSSVGRNISFMDKALIRLGNAATAASKNTKFLLGSLHRGAIKATIGLVSLGNSFGNFVRTMFLGVNGWLMALSVGIMLLFEWYQRQEEYNNNLKESMEGAKQAYEEFSKFLKDNPIEIAINGDKENEVTSLLKKYREELENAPLDLSWVVSSGDEITDKTERLKYYKQALVDAAEAEKALRDGDSFKIAHDAMKETKEWYPWSDTASDNLKDLEKGIKNLGDALNDIEPEKLDKQLDGIYKNYPKYRQAIDDYRKGLLSLDALVVKMQGEFQNNSDFKYFGKYNAFIDWYHEFEQGGAWHKSVRTRINDFKKDMNDLYKFLEDKAKNNPKLGINFNNLDNKGFIKFEKIMKDMATEQQWSQQQTDAIMADLTSRMTPAKGSTWFFNTGIYKEALDLMSEYTDEFKGKTQKDIEDGLKDGSKSGMRKALDNAKAEITAKWPSLADYIQKMFDNKDFHINLAIRLSNQQVEQSGFQKDFKDFLDNKPWGKKTLEVTRSKYEALGPKEGESITAFISRLNEDYEDYDNKIRALKKYNEKNGNSRAQELQDAIDGKNRVDDILRNYLNQEPEKTKKEKSEDRASDKKKREQEKKLREEEKRLQNEFKQLKKVKDLYEKLRDLYGDVGALSKIRNSGLVAAKYIPQNVTSRDDFNKKYRKLINELSKRVQPKSDTLKNLKDELESDKFDLSFNIDKDELDKQVSILETELQRAGDAWSRYINLVNDGLDKRTAGIMAFGVYSNQTDKTRQQNELSSRAGHYIEQKAKRTVSENEMEEILNMNEAEIKVHFSNNAEITNGLWKIVEAYQNVTKDIRSENDKLISDLYKDSLSYVERINNISNKAKRDIANIKESANNNKVATKRYNDAVSNQESIRVKIDNEYDALNKSDIGRALHSALELMNKAKGALSDFDKKNGKNLTPEQKKERQSLVNTYNTTNVSYNKALTNYQNSTQYKTIELLRPQQEKAIKETTNAQRAVSDTIPESQANRLIAQVTLKANKDKGEVMDEMFTKRGDYSQLFNNIYSLAVDNANKIAEELIAILDQRLEEGTITSEDYNKKRTEITEQVQKANENRKNGSLLFNGLGGVTKFRYDQATGQKNAAADRMETAKRNEEAVDKNVNMSPSMKIATKAMYQADFKKAKEDYKTAEAEGNKQKKKEARQDMAGSALGMIGNAAKSMAEFRDTLGDTINAFGGDTENNKGFQTFSTAVDVMGDISSGMTNAFQSIMSGDFFGAAMSIITTPLNVANAFAKLHDKKLEIQINQSKERAKQIKAAADQITSSIENSLGTKNAKSDALRDNAQLKEQMEAAGRKSRFRAQYAAVYKLLNSENGGKDYVQSYIDEIKKKEAEVRYTASTLNYINGDNRYNEAWVQAQLKNSAQYYRDNEVLDALKSQGFDKAKDISVYGTQYAALLEQRKELEYQLAKEDGKSGTDKEKIDDLRDQIADMNKQIREFVENLAKELYGIDFSSWADKLGNALTDAFKNGEDAAQAFEKTVDDIMADIVKNMFIQDAIKPMFEPLRKILFGDGGSGGMIDMNDLEGSMPKAIEYISTFFDGVKDKIPWIQELFEALNKATGGKLTNTTNSSSSLSISAQNLTEETGDLLASYVNAIRADVSISRGYLQSLMEINIPQMSAIAEAQLREMYSIVSYTKLIEENTRANTEAAEKIRKSLDSVITTSSGGKAIRINA